MDADNHLSVHPDWLAPAMMSLVQGMVMQQAIDGQPPFDDYRAAVRALFDRPSRQTPRPRTAPG